MPRRTAGQGAGKRMLQPAPGMCTTWHSQQPCCRSAVSRWRAVLLQAAFGFGWLKRRRHAAVKACLLCPAVVQASAGAAAAAAPQAVSAVHLRMISKMASHSSVRSAIPGLPVKAEKTAPASRKPPNHSLKLSTS